ncbi:MAG: phosphodiester glycosidase family protein [Lachnospiraceae bacterium]|nr:phosphodiester glycosidase family protein [Lachnospiraceae bacterium]
MKKHLWALCYSVCLLSFTVYMGLDTFVLSKSYDTAATAEDTSAFEEESSQIQELSSLDSSNKSDTEDTADDGEVIGTYENDNAVITVKEYTRNDTKVYVADVTLTSSQYLKAAFANDTYGRNVKAKTSEIASSNNAILAINGDYYGAQESGYVIRNGVVYRDSAAGKEVLCVYADGSMEVVSDSDYTAQELVDKGVWQAFSFGPGLVEDGEIAVDENDEVGKAMASNPRTAIGEIEDGHYVLVVADGRTDESEGLSLKELASFMQELGCETAYNLDGGGSSTMYFNGEVINNPTTTGHISERSVSDIVYIEE